MSDQHVATHRHGEAIRHLTEELARRHGGMFSRAEVEDVVRSSYEELSRKARVTAYLPVLTRTQAEQRLTAASAFRTDPLVEHAYQLARQLLSGMGQRWRHTQGVARRAVSAADALAEVDRPLLVAAAWLHDIGYAPPLQRTTFHPLDGALHLSSTTWGRTAAGLVAHHSGARFVAAIRGLEPLMRPFDAGRYAAGPLADALTYADQTTSLTGEPMDVEDRLADMLARHGPDSPSALAHARRAPAIRAAVRHTEDRLASRSPAPPQDGT